METTFISIHDLTDNATILYSSDSVVDVLGYTPDEIVNHSAWELFPEDELPAAQKFHRKRVNTDKAAVLAYVRVRNREGNWVGCEVCMTVVYDVIVVCTSVYRRGLKSEKRALEAPMVRRLFASSPKDPRYHMLSHLSTKFSQPLKEQQHEPRAALFLNRFTRTLTIMYATSGLNEVIGIPAETMRGRSFYYCISENCLQDAVKCLENAKGNDSIAYLRFWFRDPRIDDQPIDDGSSDEEMTTDASEDGGVTLDSGDSSVRPASGSGMDIDSDESHKDSRQSSGDSTQPGDTHEAIFGQARRAESSTSSLGHSPREDAGNPPRTLVEPVELEAVISCTSDGLVVCLRKARPMIPHPTQRPSQPVHRNGLFAAPWAHEPVLPPIEARAGTGYGTTFAPSLGPQGARRDSPTNTAVAGPEQMDFMAAIREQAVFAWALTGINGMLAEYGHGKPTGESLPQDGLPIWESDPKHRKKEDSTDSAYSSGRSAHIFGDPGLDRHSTNGNRGMKNNSSSNSSAGTPFPPPSR
ncbi:Putative PAS domain-containing protein [Septoria linicola]|uniref:PAS domain-containing protein n=1 Tax=Septoria linicola TaxID=215465 RepID=A0A9Q9EJY8_9PEZI|nr:Putative PAS domain-containing protein [Septoria linicola]